MDGGNYQHVSVSHTELYKTTYKVIQNSVLSVCPQTFTVQQDISKASKATKTCLFYGSPHLKMFWSCCVDFLIF